MPLGSGATIISGAEKVPGRVIGAVSEACAVSTAISTTSAPKAEARADVASSVDCTSTSKPSAVSIA